MKGVFVLIDGLGDIPHKKLGWQTPLEAANTPNLDALARHSRLGVMFSVKEKFIPGTSDAVVSIFGEDYEKYPRGWLEAMGVGLNIKKGDLVFRTNFGTVDDMRHRRVIDRRAGRTLSTKEATKLADAINKEVKLDCNFLFKNTLQHRGVLVFKGNFSDKLTGSDPEYNKGSNKFLFSRPLDKNKLSKKSSKISNDFLVQSFGVLEDHVVNETRRKRGFFPANIILSRAPGIYIKKLKKFNDWACTTEVPVMKGICNSLGINLFGYKHPTFKGHDAYSNFNKNLKLTIKKSIKMIKKNKDKFDYFFIYLKETDAAGHDNKPVEKMKMVELIDKKLMKFLTKFVKEGVKIVVTADHSTPCDLKAHSSAPVPLMVFDPFGKKVDEMNFSERNCKKGSLNKVLGKNLLKKVGFR
ncbi:MAG: alkaline phosphatase [Nanoarchaeota archaeon]|nr:alkaline phosphatase [Nanoarchaeota archaeon]